MTVTHAAPSFSMIDNERRSHEPSMEEILASIRKILADEDTTIARYGAASACEQSPTLEASLTPHAADEGVVAESLAGGAPNLLHEQVLPLAADIGVEQYDAEQNYELTRFEYDSEALDAPTPQNDLGAVEQAADNRWEVSQSWDETEERNAPILSPQTDMSVAHAFQALSASVNAAAQAEMIEKTTREMLRPMLKQWLDENLPVIVERLVRVEIERVARGGR